jgi:exodeoxyribonuclease VII small subunit
MADLQEPPNYRDAMTELQSIVNRLRETEDIDVDELVRDVARAKELIDYCDSKIKRADTAIKTIVSQLQVGESPPQQAQPQSLEMKR